MPPSSARGGRFRRTIALVVLLILAIGGYGFVHLGRFMSPEDPLQKADAIFVFAGSVIERPLEASDLYRQGYAPVIVFTRDVPEAGYAELVRRGIRFPTNPDLNRSLLLATGVPASALIEPDRIHDNTAQELQTLHRLVDEHRWHRLILVSSTYHLRRIRFAAWREFRGTDLQLMLHASRYDPAVPARWWTRRSDVRWMLEEVPKLAAYVLGLGA
ncbi:MAG TPA: YdcF family protein [Vicinamibacterales bacterium]|nr:YdcF family protein [Vicinamibacterales bacterium]